jgi:hypothetical protein
MIGLRLIRISDATASSRWWSVTKGDGGALIELRSVTFAANGLDYHVHMGVRTNR